MLSGYKEAAFCLKVVYFRPSMVGWPKPAAKHSHSSHPVPAPSRTEERIGRAKMIKPMGQDKDSLISQAKLHSRERKWEIHSLLPISRQISSQFLGSGTHHSYLEKQALQPWTSLLPPPFPEILLLNKMSYSMEYPFCQFLQAVSLPNLFPIPSLLTGKLLLSGQKRNPQHCASTDQKKPKTLVPSTLL